MEPNELKKEMDMFIRGEMEVSGMSAEDMQIYEQKLGEVHIIASNHPGEDPTVERIANKLVVTYESQVYEVELWS